MNINQSKFSLADLLTILAAIAFGFVCFLSTNFFTLGDTWQSVFLSLVITVLLAGLALGAKLLKRTSRNFKTSFVWEMILLVLFVGFSIFFSYISFPHFFTVSAQKDEIQNKLMASINQAENMFAEYEYYAENRENLFKNKLISVVNSKGINPSEYSDYGFENNGVSDEKQIETKMFTVHADLFPSNYNEMKTKDSIWLINSKTIIEKWNPFGLIKVMNSIEHNSKEWLAELISLSSIREKSEQTEDFTYNLTFEDVKTHFTKRGNPTPFTIGLAVISYILMLLSWFITKRHTRFPGIKIIFGFGKNADNEL